MNNRQLLKEKADSLSDAEIAEALEYITIMESLEDSGENPLEEIMVETHIRDVPHPHAPDYTD